MYPQFPKDVSFRSVEVERARRLAWLRTIGAAVVVLLLCVLLPIEAALKLGHFTTLSGRTPMTSGDVAFSAVAFGVLSLPVAIGLWQFIRTGGGRAWAFISTPTIPTCLLGWSGPAITLLIGF